MILGITGLIAAYVLLAILLLSVNLYSQWSWQIKSILIVITSVFYAVSYFSFPPLLGWPTSQTLPSHFQLLSAEIRQPDKLTGDEGAIFLWLKKIENITDYEPPRAYELSYSKNLHTKIIGAQAKIDRGTPQLGEYEDDPDLRESIYSQESGKESLELQFYDMPEPLFPDK